MRLINLAVLFVFLCIFGHAQMGVQSITEAERSLNQATAEKGAKAAFVEFLADDSVIFRPEAINGRQFWEMQSDATFGYLRRTSVFADAAANALLGYTTGSWQNTRKENGLELNSYGDYVTIWERRNGAGFRAILDITTTHNEPAEANSVPAPKVPAGSDSNKFGWSPTDVAMRFLRTSMGRGGLAAAYKEYAGEDIHVLIDREPAVYGKKQAISRTKRFTSTKFPIKVAMFQSADMAYFWNPCHFQNSEEGSEHGNCLQILKLRNKKWYIVMGVFARVSSDKVPVLKQ